VTELASPTGAAPLVSVITVCLNAARTLERTIKSVLAQSYRNMEYVIVDGGSSDDTLGILRRYGSRVRWSSEPDGGMYDAMNKGIRKTCGEWIHLLNADDWYAAPDALERAVAHLDPTRTTYFDLVRVYPDGRRILQSRTVRNWMLYISAFLPHPSLIVSRAQYDAVGLYDPSLKIASDHDLILRLVRRFPPKHVPMVLTCMEQGGMSARMLDLSLDEFTEVTVRHGVPRALAAGIWAAKRVWWKVRAHA
jgi:glycosyltransferase involved in cell wall biosynthesis